MSEAQEEELGTDALCSHQTDVGQVELPTHLVGLFLFAFNLFPSCLERLCLVECVLGVRPQLVQSVLQREVRFCRVCSQLCDGVDSWRRTGDRLVGHSQLHL